MLSPLHTARAKPVRRRLLTATVAIALVAVGVAAGAVTQRFTDVPEDHWAAKPIGWAVDAGIMQGREDGSLFEPDKPVTRAKLAQILWRYDQTGVTIGEEFKLFDIVYPTDQDDAGTSEGFNLSYSWDDLDGMAKSLCGAMEAIDNGYLTFVQYRGLLRTIIPDWLEGQDWPAHVTAWDRWRVVFYGYYSYCQSEAHDLVYETWADAGWPPLDFS